MSGPIHQEPRFGRWLVGSAAASDKRARLFCFPYAGGGTSVFYGWSPLLPAQVQVCPVHLPGRETRRIEPSLTSMDELVRQAVDGLMPFLDRPFCFFGHSMGALVAFELARQLRRQGAPRPNTLFVSACFAPQNNRLGERPMRHLPDDQFVQRLEELDGTPDVILKNSELMRLLLPVLRADFSVVETYQYPPGEPLDCPIIAFGGEQDTHPAAAEMTDWSIHTTAGFSLRLFPGGHFYLRTARHALLAEIASAFAAILGENT